jgi:uncharacterized protein
MIEFEWDKTKAAQNLKKHGVSFDEAKTAFFDDFAIQFYDSDHSDQEDRFILLGLSSFSKVLVVCHCVRDTESVVRIISARKATKSEKKFYQGA